MIKVEHDIETGETIEREMTKTELSEYNADMEAIQNRQIADEQAKATKATEKAALLTRLGITEEEAELLK